MSDSTHDVSTPRTAANRLVPLGRLQFLGPVQRPNPYALSHDDLSLLLLSLTTTTTPCFDAAIDISYTLAVSTGGAGDVFFHRARPFVSQQYAYS